jgi:PAS domain-containing protein
MPLQAAMEATRRELAVLAAEMMGAQVYLGQFGTIHLPARAARRLFRDLFEQSPQPYLIVDPRPGLRIVDSNPAYAAATLTNRRRTAGERLFDVFPDNPGVPRADGTSNLYDSLHKAAQTRRRHVMAVQRYDVRDASGNFVRKDWLPVNSPVFDEQGRLVLLLHHVEDVTGAGDRIEYV